MSCVEDLINFYIMTPPISISDDNLPKYVNLLNHITDYTLREYSECRPLLKEKEVTTLSDQIEIDILTDIDENFMDWIIFDEKSKLINGFYLPELNMYLSPIILDSLKTQPISFLQIQYVYDNLYLIKEYFETKNRIFIYNGRKVKCKPNTTYYILYEAYRTRDDILNQDCKDFEELFKINLYFQMIDSFFFTDEQPIRSVSISGISVTFNVENKESIRRTLMQLKDKIKTKLCNIYEFVERW